MSDILINFHLPFLVIALVIGYQISVYYFYLYLKLKKENLGLNKVLLAHGFVYGFLIASITTRTIYTYFLSDPSMRIIALYSSHIFAILGALSYLIIISTNEFDVILNVKITKLITSIIMVMVILIYTVQIEILQTFLILFTILIGGIYTFIFYCSLIIRSTGSIRKRLIMIIMGNFIMVLGIFSQADEFILYYSNEEQIILMIISTPIFIAGELIVFLGIYRFPAFLELKWKENLIELFIIERNRVNQIYNYDFNSKSNNLNKTIFSKGILGIEEVIPKITKSFNNKMERIQHGDYFIFLQHGDEPLSNLTYILIVNKDMKSFTYFLRSIKDQFQTKFKNVLMNLNAIEGEEKKLFSLFDIIILKFLK